MKEEEKVEEEGGVMVDGNRRMRSDDSHLSEADFFLRWNSFMKSGTLEPLPVPTTDTVLE